ncbi:MAG: diguanylate cyclase, partial [Campylobacteraceae bacterium]|nr:diguanylate cyclase [Campylobacteraceae bacterium]
MFISTTKFFYDKIPKNKNKTFTQPYLQAFENSACIAKLGFDLKIKYANRLFSQLSLCTKNECLKKELYDIFDNTNNILNEIVETLKNLQTWDGTLSLRANSDNQAFVKCSIIPIIDSKNIPQEYLLVAHDVTELMISKRVIRDNIYIDLLTKLPNRIQLIKDKLNFSLKSELTLIILNIDSFQAINTIYGNDFGDEVLKVFSNWLKDNLPHCQANLYKFEADVYAILIPFNYNKNDLKNYLKNINYKISKEGLQCKEIDINLAFTIGVAQGRKGLLKLASIAYKEAKKEQKNYIIHDPDNKREEEYIKGLIAKDSMSFLDSQHGFWYAYLTKNQKDTTQIQAGDKVDLTYEIRDLSDNIIYSFDENGMKKYWVDHENYFRGFREAVKLLKQGEDAWFIFPSGAAYGYHGDEKKIGSNVPI